MPDTIISDIILNILDIYTYFAVCDFLRMKEFSFRLKKTMDTIPCTFMRLKEFMDIDMEISGFFLYNSFIVTGSSLIIMLVTRRP